MGKEIELEETGIYQLFMPGMHPLLWILFDSSVWFMFPRTIDLKRLFVHTQVTMIPYWS